MQKFICIILLFVFLSGCYQSSLTPMMMVGPAAGATQGKVVSSAVSSGINYGVKHKTGKYPIEHIIKREKDKIVKKVVSIEKKVIEQSASVKEKILQSSGRIINQKNTQNINNKATSLRWVLHLKEIKNVKQEEAFPANKPRYSYLPE